MHYSFKLKFIFLAGFIFMVSACSKDDSELPNQVGQWDVIRVNETEINGVLKESETIRDTFHVTLNKDESGKIVYSDENVINIEWDKYYNEEWIVFFEERIDDEGNYSYNRIENYEIIIDEVDSQEWLYKRNVFLVESFEDIWYYERVYLNKNQ